MLTPLPIGFFSYLISPSTDSPGFFPPFETQQGSPLKVTSLWNAFESWLTKWRRARFGEGSDRSTGELGDWSHPSSITNRYSVWRSDERPEAKQWWESGQWEWMKEKRRQNMLWLWELHWKVRQMGRRKTIHIPLFPIPWMPFYSISYLGQSISGYQTSSVGKLLPYCVAIYYYSYHYY